MRRKKGVHERRSRSAQRDEHLSIEPGPAEDNSATNVIPKTKRAVWPKVFAVVTAILIPIATLIYANADSHLKMAAARSRPFEIRGYKSSGETFTALFVLYSHFTNSGLHADHVDRVEIRSVNLDTTLKSEPRFVDRQDIAWHEQKELRFEVLITASRNSFSWHDFVVTFYDSKGRQVAQAPFTTRLGAPGDIVPRVKQMKPAGPGAWESVVSEPPRSNPTPTLIAASIAFSVPKIYHNRERRFFAQIREASGEVIGQSNPDGEVELNGRVELNMTLLRTNATVPFTFGFWTDPPESGEFHYSIEWTVFWSDGSRVVDTIKIPQPANSSPGPVPPAIDSHR
jgi:hypothetical protein